MSFTPDTPSTEQVLSAVLDSPISLLPEAEQRFGSTLVSWWEMDPGEVYIHAEGGSPDDRHYASTLVGLQLAPHGYRRAQFDLDDIHPESGRYTSQSKRARMRQMSYDELADLEDPVPPDRLYHFAPKGREQSYLSSGIPPTTFLSQVNMLGDGVYMYGFDPRYMHDPNVGDLYEIDARGLQDELRPDYELQDAWYHPGPISPERIRRLA